MPYSLPFPPCTLSSVCPTAAYPLPPILYVSYSYLSPAPCSLCVIQLPIHCPLFSMYPVQLPILYTLSSMCPTAAYSLPAVLYVPYTAAYPLHTLLYIFYSCLAVLYVSYRYLSTARCPLCVLKLPILCTVSSYVTSLPPSEPLAPGSSLSPSWVEFLGSNDP